MKNGMSGRLTPLPPSPLRSGGAGLQESLHHYALRISAMCCLSIRKLEEFLLRDDVRAPKAGNAIFPSSWIGPRSNFRTLLAVLKRDTGQHNLHTGTFHVVADTMGRGGTRRRQIRGDGRVWCPACYLHWDDLTSSEPLIWAFDMLSACPVHNVRLESHCRECGSAQAFSVSYRERRACQECRSPLGHASGTPEVDKQALWVNATLLQFTRWIGDVDEPISGDNYLQFLELLRARRDGEGALPPVIREYVASVHGKRRKQVSLPTVSTFLNLAAFQGVAIQDMLCEPAFAASAHMVQGSQRFDGLLFRRRDLQPAQRRVVYIIDKLAANASPIPPPSVVWRELGLWCDGVRDYCPLEHHAFMEKFRAQRPPVSMSRFKLAASSSIRLVKGLVDDTDPNAVLRRHLEVNHGFSDTAVDYCLMATLNLAEALRLSSDESELSTFEGKRAAGVARWAADGAGDG